MRVGVIGCGAAGTAVLDAVVRTAATLRRRVEVAVFEPGGAFGPGRAYDLASGTAPLNLVPERMSVRPDQPAHFRDWLGIAERDVYLPRATYGRYLADVVSADLTIAMSYGSRVELIDERIVELTARAGEFHAWSAQDRQYRFDVVFLCVGSAEPDDEYGLAGAPGFIADPCPLADLPDAVDPNASVAVLGSGLSAVDSALRLAERGHQGSITLVSRGGYLPAVRGRTAPRTTRHGDLARIAAQRGRVTVADLLRVIVREFRAHGIPVHTIAREFQRDEPPAGRLRRQRREAAIGNRASALLLDLVETLATAAWPRFDDAGRAEFVRDWHALVDGLASPMPMSSANGLCALLDAGRLRLLGGIQKVTSTETGFAIDTETEQLTADIVINADRQYNAAIPARAADLVGTLLTSGLAVPHPHGGVGIQPQSLRLLDRACRPVPGLYALGGLTVGQLYLETTTIAGIARRARQAVAHVFERPGAIG
ncbi:MAG TPA: FAD/NAD(P)-binding protein [Pseudonocardiaceae bacterium]|nr:FAD/NAD(P)-binding protein [Pseudonocardiaceae bacterium]